MCIWVKTLANHASHPTSNSALVRLILVLFVLAVTSCSESHADEVMVGKVVIVADGDTITVLENRTQYRIRLFGIDAPERGQDFGTRAKRFASDLVFGKQVRVIKQDIDRYGRIVGIVYVGDVGVNEELVRNGSAWVYRRYCKIPVCGDWLAIETWARENGIGLWSHRDPVPPWEFRRRRRVGALAYPFAFIWFLPIFTAPPDQLRLKPLQWSTTFETQRQSLQYHKTRS
jgi:endonuclease YncB( thermonuclease family)